MDISIIVPVIITVLGAYLSQKLGCFHILHPFKTARFALTSLKGKGAFSSLSLALAGTLGVGNVIGVAVGIATGGAGSVFWLLISSIFSSVIKYSETVLVSASGGGCGMAGVILQGFPKFGKPLSWLFLFFCLALSLVMGAALQCSTLSNYLSEAYGAPPHVSLSIFLLLLIPIILGGISVIERATLMLVPGAFVLYVLLCLTSILKNIESLVPVTVDILRSAFLPDALFGTGAGILASSCFKEGYLRGILSNEAGAGTSSLAHSRNPARDPVSVGAMGLLEVVFDTSVLCMLTAYGILVSVNPSSADGGIRLVLSSIGSAFRFADALLGFCVLAFSYSTVACWFYYGESCFRMLFGNKKVAFASMYIVAVSCGFFLNAHRLIAATDTVMCFLVMITAAAVIKGSDRVLTLSEQSGIIKRRGRCRGRRALNPRKNNQGD